MIAATRLLALLLLAVPAPAWAGLNLGMKLACKKYGDAWAAGDKPTLLSAVTDDFADVWDAMPDGMFKMLPKGGTEGSQVLASSKSPTEARVEVRTPDGPITFLLDGAGLKWKVADLEVQNDRNETVSLKHSLAASLAARRFLAGMGGKEGFGPCLSREFANTLKNLGPEGWRRVKVFFPALPDPEPTRRPTVRFHGSRATISSPFGDRSEGVAVVTLVRQNGWRVDDLAVTGDGMNIPSLRKALPTLSAAAALGEFFKDPKGVDPQDFAAPGKLREELAKAHAGGPAPPNPADQKLEHLRVGADPRQVFLKYPDKWILVSTTRGPTGQALVANLHLHQAGAWREAADLLALQRKVIDSGLGSLLGAVGK